MLVNYAPGVGKKAQPEYKACTMGDFILTRFWENLFVILAHSLLGTEGSCSEVS